MKKFIYKNRFVPHYEVILNTWNYNPPVEEMTFLIKS